MPTDDKPRPRRSRGDSPRAGERELTAFRIIAEAAVEASETPPLCRRVVEGLVEALGFDFGGVGLLDSEKGVLTNAYAVGFTEEQLAETEAPVSLEDERHVSAYTARTREPLFVPDVQDHPINETHGDWLQDLSIRGFISWPLVGTYDQLIGVLQLSARTPKVIAEGEQIFFATVAGMFATVIERRLAQEALAESEEKFRNLVERSNDGIALVMDGRLAYVNPRVAKTTGYAVEDICGEPFDRFVDPAELPAVSKYYEKRMRGEEVPAIYETAIRRADGSKMYVELNVGTIPYRGGTAELVFIRDLTERKRAEEAHERERKALQLVAEAAVNAKNVRHLCRLVVTGLAEALDFEIGAIRLYDEEKETLQQTASYGLTRDETDALFPTQYLDDRRYFGSHVARTRGPIFAPDVTKHDIYKTHRPRIEELELAAVITWPVIGAGGSLLGIVSLASRTPKDIGEQDRAFFETVAGTFATVLERRRAEDEVRKSEAKHRLLLESISSPVIALGRKMNILYYNDDYAAFAGLPPEELEGKNLIDLFPSFAETETYRVYKKALASGTPQEAEGEFGDRYLHTAVYPMPWGILAISTDVTQRRYAEEALRESELEFRLVFENANDAVLWADASTGLILRCNRAAEELTGKPRAEIVGQHFSSLHPPEEDTYHRDLFSRFEAEGVPLEAEAKVSTPSGDIRDIVICASATTVGGKDIIQAVFRDVTEHKRAEETARRETEFSENILNTAVDTIFVFDPQTGKALRWNKAFSEVSGYSDEEIAAMKAPDDWYSEEDLNRAAAATEEIFAEGSGTIEMSLITKGGKTVPTEYVGSLVKDAEGNPRYIISVGRDVTERKGAEEALRESESRFRSVVEQSPFSTAIYAPDGTLLLANEAFMSIWGLTREAADIFLDSFNLLTDKQIRASGIGSYVERGFAGEVTLIPPHLYRLEGGPPDVAWEEKEVWVRGFLYPVKGPGGEVHEVVAMLEDVTERIQAEEALRESEEKFRSIVESSPAGMHMYELTADGQLVFTGANPAADEILGVDNAQFVGKTIEEAFPASADTEILERYRRAAADGELWHAERIDYEDERVSGAFDVTAFQTSPGKMTATFLDITERKRAEEALRESEERYRVLFEGGNDAIFVFNISADGKPSPFVEVNNEACRHLGYSAAELHELTPIDLVPPELQKGVADIMRRLVREGELIFEWVHLRKGGTRIPVEISALVFEFRGESTVISIVRDISERKRAEGELRRAADEKTAILSSMSEHVVYHNKELEILWANEAAASSVGLSPESLVGRHCYEVWHGHDEPCDNCPVVAALETGGPHEEELATPDGRVWYVRGYPIKDEDGNVTNAVEVTLEITDLKRVEESLKRALAKNEALLEAVPDLMFIVDREGNYVDFKRAKADRFALAPETIIGKNVRDTGFSADDERKILAGIERTLSTGESSAIQYELDTPLGRGTFEARIAKLDDEQVLSVVREITQRKASDED